MQRTNRQVSSGLANSLLAVSWSDGLTTEPLIAADQAEVLHFLAERPIHNCAMAGLIRDNGMINEQNRGVFYGCRNIEGSLEAVALIGHAILMDARTDGALEALAELAKGSNTTHLIMAEESCAARFLRYYSDGGQKLYRKNQQILFELRWPNDDPAKVQGLRLGSLDDLDLVVPIHARMSFDESGIDPLASDPMGFTRRCARRLLSNRTYVLAGNDKLLFKADVFAETDEATYLEGVWANPAISGNGCALSCLIQLAKLLLTKSKAICLLSNVANERAKAFYLKAGFTPRDVYDSVFLKRPALFADRSDNLGASQLRLP
jgi:hypothetical protein